MMRENESTTKIYAYSFHASAIVILVASLLFYNPYLIVLAALLLLLSSLYFESGHIINNLLLGRGKLIEIYNGYKLSENLKSMVKLSDGMYLSISCAVLRRNNAEYNGELIDSIISNARFPFEFSVGLGGVNKSKLVEGLEIKRKMKEIEISRTDQKKYTKVNELKRELSIIENELREIQAERPLALSIRLKTFGYAQNESESCRESSENIEQLANMFSSTLGFEQEILKGERLIDEFALER